jgi:hypothetical protein
VIQKVWFRRVWCMAGRWALWSLSEPVRRPSVLSRAWFASIHAPYYRGAGVALTAGPWSLRLGLCRPGLDLEESDDEYSWDDFNLNFEEHLEASLFESGPINNVDDYVGELQIEEVTAFVDTRGERLVAVVYHGGEVEYVRPVEPWAGS